VVEQLYFDITITMSDNQQTKVHKVAPKLEYEVDQTKACWKVRYELKKCLIESPCMQEDKWSAKRCLTDSNARINKQCHSFLTLYRTCRRQQIDMRSRFRGRKGDV